MDSVIAQILEVVKYILPALVVFITVYFIMNRFFNMQMNLEAMKLQQASKKEMTPLKLQAYERLMVFCERINALSLANRLRTKGMNITMLKQAMMIAIQQEFEHNIAQQMYVTDQLWQIIEIAKNDTLNFISSLDQGSDGNMDASMVVNQILTSSPASNGLQSLGKAKDAIKKEVSLQF